MPRQRDFRNRGMDIASLPWLNPMMRSGFLTLCGLLALQGVVSAQGLPPTFTTHPASVSVFVGEAVTLTVAVEGDSPIALQWQKNSVPIPGAASQTLFLNSAQLTDLALYNVVATNAHGTTTSLSALVFVTKRPQSIAFAPAVTTVVAGSGIVLATTAGSGLPVTLTLVSGAASLNGNILVGAGGSVVVRATQAGNDFYAAAETVDRTFSFVSGSLSPFLTSPPVDQTVTAGTTATLRAVAIGTPAPTFQWEKAGVAIAGATSATLNVPATTLADAGRYTVTATNLSGTATASATLTIRAAPVLTATPASQSVIAGDAISFTVAATGFPVPTFQWRKNGTVVVGATNATLTFPRAVATDAGRYDVVATNALGSVTSDAATLTVTTRDFSGTYLGRIDYSGAANAGEFALLVRPNRRATFLARRTGNSTAVLTDLTIDLAGNFAATVGTLGVLNLETPFRGTIDEVSGTITGTLTDPGFLDVRLIGTRAPAGNDPRAGFYAGALIGTASGRAFAVVAPDGDTLLVYANTTAVYSARGNLPANGRLVSGTEIPFDVTFNAGTMTGTVRTPPTGTVTLAGVSESRAGTERLINLSVRAITSPGAATLIAGFVVTGPAAKQVLLRAAGPALAPAPFNVPNALADPVLQLLRGANPIAQNDEWGTPAANTPALNAAVARSGAFPFRAGSADAALLTTLAPGPYTVTVTGGTGVALAEIYEVLENNEVAGARRLINASARGLVTPAAPFIAGFVIAGIGPQRVLLRGVGPTLSAPPFGVAGTLQNPEITLYRGATAVKTNDDWFRDPEAAIIRDASVRAGAFALGANSLDAAILIFLEPGAYTVQVNAPANATGLALVEIYEATP